MRRERSIHSFKQLAACESGATLAMMGVVFMLLVMALAMTVDIGRLYAVQTKAQNASDAALLGAVSTINTTDLDTEMNRLFNANYPANYMGTTVSTIITTQISNDPELLSYEATFTVTVPTLVMNLFGTTQKTVTIVSQVSKGFHETKLEVALVLDNTGSMSSPASGGSTSKMEALKVASKTLVDILISNSKNLNNLHISVVPYDVSVNIGPNHSDWIQSGSPPPWYPAYNPGAPAVVPYLTSYNDSVAAGFGIVGNRVNDVDPTSQTGYSDLTDDPPTSETLKFRTPIAGGYRLKADGNYGYSGEYWSNLPQIGFALNSKSDLYAILDKMAPNGNTRINMGMMWGWFTLSPKWQGLWDAGKANLPGSKNPRLLKVMVLMTDGMNTAFLNYFGGSNDDVTTANLCSAIKADGITLYTIGFGRANDLNDKILRDCATKENYYFFAPNNERLEKSFKIIADDIVYNTLHLSK